MASDVDTRMPVDIEFGGSVSQMSVLKEKERRSEILPAAEDVVFDQAATRALLQKLDLRLIPFLALIYLLCFLDRTNVGNAKLVNLEADLGMKGLDYNIALAVFFPFYVLAEIPSNMMMKRYRPSIWITNIIMAWGLVMTFMGFVHNFQGLVACRIFLGIAEGGLFPGVNYYITMWYRRHECGFRMALFFSAATIAGCFGGLLARGISEMDGIGGKAGWSWIFILEGLLTFIVGSISFLVIPDNPASARFLTPSEKAETQRRLDEDAHNLSNEFHLKYVMQAFKDWKIYLHMLIALGVVTPLYSISLFLPTIIKNMGYKNNTAQLMSAPPYVSACLCTILASYVADKVRQRGVFILGFDVIAISGFIMLLASDKPHVQYGGSFLAAAGIFPLIPLASAWNSNNIGGSLKRGVGLAMQFGAGNLGGVIASFVYLPEDAPRFTHGHSILIAFICMSFVLSVCMMVYLRSENARRDAQLATLGLSLADYTKEVMEEEREKGDNTLFYRYTI